MRGHLFSVSLVLLRNLLSEDGTIWIQIDDEEQAYLKVICDEIFGRSNFINLISVNMKNAADASGGGEDNRLKKNCEFILVYAKNFEFVSPFKGAYEYTEIYEYIVNYKKQGKSWHYTSVLIDKGAKVYVGSTVDGDGNEIKIYQRPGACVMSIKQLMKAEGLSEKDVYYKYGMLIFEAKDAQSSIRTRVIEAKKKMKIADDIISIEYIPKTGKNKGSLYEQFYKGDKCRLFAWLRDISELKDGTLYKKDLQGTYWDFTSSINNLSKEGGVIFPKGKKPEALVSRIIEMTTKEGDLVFDSFLGSGTTAAAATKMNRVWIGIEFGKHCYTHCIPRLKTIIDGTDNGGITEAVDWHGGGGYKFYELAPSLIEKDKYGNPVISDKYNPMMLAAAVAKLNGYFFAPDPDIFWKQGYSQDNSYIYVTTAYLNARALDGLAAEVSPLEHLLICAPAFDTGLSLRYDNIQVRKIPQSVLNKCEYGVDNYDLNIVDIPIIDEEECEDD